MPIIRINADGDIPRLHNTPRAVDEEVSRHETDGPVVVMIHGYKYKPGMPGHCPHLNLLALHPNAMSCHTSHWPRQLGFGTGHENEGLAIAFGWDARNAPWIAQKRAQSAGRALARVLCGLHRIAPERPVHIVAHSMGIELALEALHHIPVGAVQRIICMTGASYISRTAEALETDAGKSCDFINVTSRENDLFDFLFERLIAPPSRHDRAIGLGLKARNVVTFQLDCPDTLMHFAKMGCPIGPAERRICHWSSYTRPGVLRLYNDILRRPEKWTLDALNRADHTTASPRWSRLMAMPEPSLRLLMAQKTP